MPAWNGSLLFGGEENDYLEVPQRGLIRLDGINFLVGGAGIDRCEAGIDIKLQCEEE
jgi:hypothetical protein